MKTQVEAAVWNNIVWCGIVCSTHGIAHTSGEHVWGLASGAPVYYPDIITSSRHATVEEVKGLIGDREIVSVKDSFANLDLTPLGMRVLFEAQWICHAPMIASEPFESEWRVVATPEELAQWTLAHGIGDVLRPELLKREDVRIYMHVKEGKLSGFIANLSTDAVGVSNVFSQDQAIEPLWPDITRLVATDFPGLPMVGYEQGEDLACALRSGWKAEGPLRVWLR